MSTPTIWRKPHKKKTILCLFCNIPTLIKLQYDELVTFPQYIVSVVSSTFPVNSHRKGTGLLFLKSVLIDQNYVFVVVILITFKSNRYLRSSRIHRFSKTLEHLSRQLFLPAWHFNFLFFPCHEIKFSFEKLFLLNMFTSWITCVYPDNILSYPDNTTIILSESLWNGQQYHFFAELNKTNCFHRIGGQIAWCGGVPTSKIYFFFTITIKSSSQFTCVR